MSQGLSQKQGKIFYGWFVVLAGAMVAGAGVGMLLNCSGVFIKPVTEALGFSRGGFTFYTTIQSILTMIMAPFFGELFRRFSIRKVILIASTLCCTVYFCYSFATQLWHFYVLAVLYGLGASGITIMAVGTLVNRWFREKKGLAAGLAFSGSGVTASIMLAASTKVIDAMGWQWGYRLQAVCAFALFMLAILIMRDKPEDIGLVPYGAEKEIASGTPHVVKGITRAQALKTPTFYIMGAGFFLNSMIGMGINPHISAALTDIGYNIDFAAGIISTVMVVMIFGKIVLGVSFDKMGPVLSSFTVGFVLLGSSLLMLFAGASPIVPWVFTIFFGLGYSTLSVPYSYLTGAIFGDREFSAIYSLCTMMASAGGAIGPLLSGMVFDATGSYTSVFTLYAVSSIVVITLLIFASKQGIARGYAEEIA